MPCTEQEAAQRWCPLYRPTHTDVRAGFHPGQQLARTVPGRSMYSTQESAAILNPPVCIGARCMAWEFLDSEFEMAFVGAQVRLDGLMLQTPVATESSCRQMVCAATEFKTCEERDAERAARLKDAADRQARGENGPFIISGQSGLARPMTGETIVANICIPQP